MRQAGLPYHVGQVFAFSECQTNKDVHNTETKHVHEPDIAHTAYDKIVVLQCHFLKWTGQRPR